LGWPVWPTNDILAGAARVGDNIGTIKHGSALIHFIAPMPSGPKKCIAALGPAEK
jgi:hypothetical protein